MSWTHQSALNIDYDSEKELGEDTGFFENIDVAFDHEVNENLSNSESIVMMEDVNNAYTALHEYTGQARFDTLSNYGNEVAGFDLDLRDLDAEQDLIIKLRQQHPDDTRLRTYSQMIADKKPELKALRERSQDVYDRAGVMGTVGSFLGMMGAHAKDPLFMYSLPLGAGPIAGKTALSRAALFAKKEAVIAGGAEVPVSVSRYQWKEKIESPWTVWDAAEETLMVMAGTGLLSGVGYAIGDALGWTHAAKVARENGLPGEAQLLEKRARVIEESEAQGVSVEEVLDARVEAESQMGTHSGVDSIESAKDTPKEQDIVPLSPARNKPVRLQELNDIEVEKVELDFRSKQAALNLTPEQYRKAAQIPQEQITDIGKELEGVMGESIAFLNPGLKDLDKMIRKINRKGYKGTGNLTDVIRVGFAVKDASDIPQIIEKISKRYEILDEGIVVNAAGYSDQKLIVRFDNGLIGEIQIWEPHLLAVKEGAEFVKDVFPKHLQEYVADMDIPLRKDSGHDLYDHHRKLWENGSAIPGKEAEVKQLIKRMSDLYSDARRFAKTSWNDPLASGRPESYISAPLAGSQVPGSASSLIKKAEIEPSAGSTITAGRPSQLKNVETSLKSNDAIVKSSTDSIPKDTNISKSSKYNADLEVPGTPTLEGSEITATVRSYAEVMEEFDAEEQIWKDFETCMVGLADGK